MMEKNYYATIELAAIYSTAVVFAYHNNLIHVVAKVKVPTQGFYDGRIVDKILFKNMIIEMKDQLQSQYKIHLNEAILILPNNNHKVYSASVDYKIMTANQIIGLQQIEFARQRIKEATLAENEILVDEVPTLYTLDLDRSMRTMPIGYQSSLLKVKSNIHTLPKDIVYDLLHYFQDHDVRILDSYINCHCAARAVSRQYELEDNCICIHIGQEVTTISAYNKNLLAKSTRVSFGLLTLIDYLSKMLTISFKRAMELIESYFICNIDYTSDVYFDKEQKLNEKRISGILLNQLTQSLDEIVDAVEKLRKDVNFDLSCKYILSGLLNDYEYFTDEFVHITKLNIIPGFVKKIGLEDSSYINHIGAMNLFLERHREYVLERLNEGDEEIANRPSFESKIQNPEKKMEEQTAAPVSRFKDIFDD